MNKQLGFISEQDFWVFVVAIAMIGFIFGLFISFGVPAIWDFFKPLIHKWSA